MPGLNAAQTVSRVIVQHDTADDYLTATYPTLRRHEASANIVLAHALKRVTAEAALSRFPFLCDEDVDAYFQNLEPTHFQPRRNADSFWLTMWSPSASGRPILDLVLTCVNWTLGEYPIFIWAPHHRRSFSSEWLKHQIVELTEFLRSCVPPERVFSVFGMTHLVKAFARQWTALTGFQVEPEPFYAAHFSYCTPQTFRDSDGILPPGHALRRANLHDLDAVAQLCKEFADDTVFFPLSIDKARVEARELIMKGQIWVYDADGSITTICAVTRNSQRVSAITKVYTTPIWRRRRCAELLVRDVTARLLFDCGKDSVVLYVGHDNSAQRVYDRVGFAGLCGRDKPEGVEDSLELGFIGTKRGHW
ncbi:uncharacterized protein LAESUDRAFT_648289 [Laetiporus sulphureus 93-53]|uniref:N-acetyltransferase domain-containing protein n=1 Tax=Laetiporus sulphureus 93-53 TaxID=1314785 RepID=A0A165FA92_9APHY|nr:uncharacterized protein LAESUDRAFT_648289 [Laetiporus sulphureus 93-53]KZT08665.1 hypothetical protein LAESUDRAFT_648289 [Laetiporus sulphureus 93-53]